ncbi:unnamed protein product [Rotaria sp. Silwood1]|nr:unnamed protein product [Rotaria sp. Silwood1]CAF4852818.1 unnamed protein product [Rotaria sp. Silwood1]
MVSMVFPTKPTLIKDEKTMHRRRSIIREFALNTSTHGLPGIARSESIHNRIFWSISFLCFTAVMIYFVTTAILSYFGYPTQINVDIITEWPQYFPAVSICNGAPFHLDRFIRPFLNYTYEQNLINSTNTSTIPAYLASSILDFLIHKTNKNESMDSYLFSLSSMLYKCTFNNLPCSIENFTTFNSAFYGRCYTFNAKMKSNSNNSVRYVNHNGGNGVLDLEFYVHSHQYVPYFWKGAGMVSLVHDNTQLPLIDSFGVLLTPGKSHKLGYKKKTTFLLSSPYTSCTNNIPLPMEIMFNTYYYGADYSYSETVCYELCGQTYAYEKCGCVNPVLWNARSIVLPDTNNVVLAPLCNMTNTPTPCYTQAVDELLNSLSLRQKYCSDCSQHCSIIDFIIHKSALASPLEWQMDGIKAFVESSIIPLPSDWSTEWRSHIKTNYLALSVVCETTIVENSTQTAQLGIVDVLSNIGGQTGLWIGISFLSVMEFIEMLYRVIRYQLHSIRLARRKNKQ